MRRSHRLRFAPQRGDATTAPLPLDTDRRSLLGRGIGTLGLAALGWLPGPGAGAAPSLTSPRGAVVLSVVGRVGTPNAGARADFDMAMIESLPDQQRITTRTPWFQGPRTFSGPLLRDVLAAAGADGSELRAIALNNYKVNIPMEDVRRFPMVLATRLDGKPMAVRDKGPLFIVYPYDADAELRSERYYSRSAWQLRTLEVR